MMLTQLDQMVYKKVEQSKNKCMSLAQVAASVPGAKERDLKDAIRTLLNNKLLVTSKSRTGDETLYHAQTPEDAQKTDTMTAEQIVVRRVINQGGNTGVSFKSIRAQIPQDQIASTILRKVVDGLEKMGLIKSFKNINAPTISLYCDKRFEPPIEVTGGVWYDNNMDYDQVMVNEICNALYAHVYSITFPKRSQIPAKSRALVSNPVYPVGKTKSLPSPHALLAVASKITTAKLSVKNVMEVMRALQLDGLIEVVKPHGGVNIPFDEHSDDEEEYGSATKRRRLNGGGVATNGHGSDDDLDEEERSRREEKEKQKLREKAKARLKKEREREKAREKKERREKRRREKEKEKARKKKKREKEKEKKEKAKRKKEREKEKKRKRKSRDDSDEDDDSDGELRAITDLEERKSSSSRKARSRTKSAVNSDASSDDSDSDLSDSDSDSSSDSDSESDSDSDDSDSDDDSDSSVSSNAIDTTSRSLKSHGAGPANLRSAGTALSQPAGLQDLSDTAIVYRAVNRLKAPLGHMSAPCGKCPVFAFCDEQGPVNPAGCEYVDKWLDGTQGGWKDEEQRRQRKEDEIAKREAEAAAAAAAAAGGAGGADTLPSDEVDADGEPDFSSHQDAIQGDMEDMDFGP